MQLGTGTATWCQHVEGRAVFCAKTTRPCLLTHAFGNFTYLSRDSADYSCESGNCLAMDYVPPACIGSFEFAPPKSTLWAARFDANRVKGIDIRYRILSTTQWSPELLVGETPGMTGETGGSRTDLVPSQVCLE